MALSFFIQELQNCYNWHSGFKIISLLIVLIGNLDTCKILKLHTYLLNFLTTRVSIILLGLIGYEILFLKISFDFFLKDEILELL